MSKYTLEMISDEIKQLAKWDEDVNTDSDLSDWVLEISGRLWLIYNLLQGTSIDDAIDEVLEDLHEVIVPEEEDE